MASIFAPRLLRVALAAVDDGWPVFPLVPGGKRPALSGWPQAATTDPDVVARWWARAPYNVGIACGPAGLLVVDLDGEDGCGVFAGLAARAGAGSKATYTVRTPSGGEHRYYAVGSGPSLRSTVGTLGRHVDTRGAGGYVVAAGSVRRIGGRPRFYRVIDPARPRPVPGWLVGLLQPSAPVPAPVVVLAGRSRAGYVGAAVAGETRRVSEAVVGTRNAVLFDAAVRLGTLVAAELLDEQNVRGELLSACAVHFGVDGFTAAEAERAIANGLRYGLQRPRQVRAG